MRNVRFLSIDIDSLQEQNNVIQQVHIGLSILNSQSLSTSKSISQPTQVIESHQYVVGSPKFARSKSNRFLFGKLEAMSLPDLKDKIRLITSNLDIILVFHGGSRELWALDNLNINLSPLYTIDTV